MRVDGYTPPAARARQGDWQVATDGALEALGERLIRGRFFTAADTLEARPSRSSTRRWPRSSGQGRDPIGGRFKSGGPDTPWITVVGIVGDVRHNGITTRDQAEVLPAVLAVEPERRLCREHRARSS